MMKGRGFIPKVSRNYVRQDFSDLLNELQGVPVVQESEVEKDIPEKKEVKSVDLAFRHRASLMDNPKMLYAYSSKSQVLHDRDCFRVVEIADVDFRMLTEFRVDMKTCPMCYRRAMIRSGVGDDRRRMDAYERFFNQVGVSNRDLYTLLIENKARLKWINNDVMQLRVHEDSWQIRRDKDGLELWHNNYIRLEDMSRHFKEGFHRQTDLGNNSVHNIIRVILSYDYGVHMAQKEFKTNKQLAHEELLKEHEKRRELKSALVGLIEGGFDEVYAALLFLHTMFDEAQVEELVKGAERGLSLKQLLVYAKPELSAVRMKEARRGLELHISKSDVKSYALPEVSVKEMRKAKTRLFFKKVKKDPKVIWFRVRDRVVK